MPLVNKESITNSYIHTNEKETLTTCSRWVLTCMKENNDNPNLSFDCND